jgi:hypothetical protein
MKATVSSLALLFAIVCVVPVGARDNPAALPWLEGFFRHYAAPLPSCLDVHACTAEEQANRDDFSDVRLQMAESFIAVSYDPKEPPLFRGARGRGHTALRLAAVGAHETGLRPRLVRGQCNPGECDGGKAVGVGQVHVGDYGLRLIDGAGIFLCTKEDHNGCVQAPDLLADNVLMARVMLHILRQGGLGLYTGEGATEGEASLTIRDWEATWYRDHKPPSDADVLEALAEDE